MSDEEPDLRPDQAPGQEVAERPGVGVVSGSVTTPMGSPRAWRIEPIRPPERTPPQVNRRAIRRPLAERVALLEEAVLHQAGQIESLRVGLSAAHEYIMEMKRSQDAGD